MFSKRSIGGEATPLILVLVNDVGENSSCQDLLALVKSCAPKAVLSSTRDGSLHLSMPRFKLRYDFLTLPENDLDSVLDAVKVAGMLVIVYLPEINAAEENDYLRRQINVMRKKKLQIERRRKTLQLLRMYHNLRLQKVQSNDILVSKRFRTSYLTNEYSRTFRLHWAGQIARESAIVKKCLDKSAPLKRTTPASC